MLTIRASAAAPTRMEGEHARTALDGAKLQRLATARAIIANAAPRRTYTSEVNTGAPVQRKIDWATESERLGQVRNIDEVIKSIQRRYPHVGDSPLRELLDDIEAVAPIWTLHQVYLALRKLVDRTPLPLGQGAKEGDVRMPEKAKEAADFGFTTRTRAQTAVVSRRGPGIAIADATQDESAHAEAHIMSQLDLLLGEKTVHGDETITITINNSPCLGRCAPQLANWKRKNWRGAFIVRYANPYGSEEEFRAAKKILTDAGIVVRSFPADRYVEIEKLTDRQRKDFTEMKRRRKSTREYRRRMGDDDVSDDSDMEQAEEERASRPAASPPRRGRSKVRERSAPSERSRSPRRVNDTPSRRRSRSRSRGDEEKTSSRRKGRSRQRADEDSE